MASPACPMPSLGGSAVAPNPIPIPAGTQAIKICNSNPLRKQFYLINVGTAVVYVGFGAGPTSTSYNIPLSACSANHDATGASLIDGLWRGELWAICPAGGLVAFTELI